MKKTALLSLMFLFATLFATKGNATNWVQKANFNMPCAGSTCGTIDSLNYIFCGTDLYLRNPVTDTYFHAAPFPGAFRVNASSFPNGDDLYVGLGLGQSYGQGPYRDFYLYHLSSNQWDTIPLMFPGVSLWGASVFSLSGIDYIVGGLDSSGTGNSILWKHDPALGWNWSHAAPFPGTPRYIGTATAAGGYGFFATGFGTNGSGLSDCWRYNATINHWDSLAYSVLAPRGNTVSFEYQGMLVVGLGQYCAMYGDLAIYDPATGLNGQWLPFDSIPTGERSASGVATYKGNVYVFTGMTSVTPQVLTPEVWEYSVGVTTGMQNQQGASFDVNIFPNPSLATDHIMIDLPNEGGYEVILFDSSGKMVRKQTAIGGGSVELSREDLSAGIYLCKIIRLDIESEPTIVKRLIFQ